jgi:hypothetical protein
MSERLQARERARIYGGKVRRQAGHARCTSGALLTRTQIRGLQVCAHIHRIDRPLDKTEAEQEVQRQ